MDDQVGPSNSNWVGKRQPMSELFASGTANGQGWVPTGDATRHEHTPVNLATGWIGSTPVANDPVTTTTIADGAGAYVACVR